MAKENKGPLLRLQILIQVAENDILRDEGEAATKSLIRHAASELKHYLG